MNRNELVYEDEEGSLTTGKIWANSGDSHLMEPPTLFSDALPPHYAERMPRSVKDDDGLWETIHVDGQTFRRKLPFAKYDIVDENGLTTTERAPGANDMALRIHDLNEEGIWGELVYTSIGMWMSSIRDPDLITAGCRVINDWAIEFQRFSPRHVCTGMVPLLSVESAAEEVYRTAGMGFRAVSLPVTPTIDGPDWHGKDWEPLWSVLAETNMVIGFHIGSEPHDASDFTAIYFRGPGGHLLNYLEASFGGQRAVAKMITSGVFDRHPTLRAIVSEGGATWGPFVGDRLDEAYRQHASKIWPRLAQRPSEYLQTNIYASFQHDPSAVTTMTAMGWKNVCWGSDYPHVEGTYGHTQKTLHELFDDLPPADRDRITKGAFQDLFPHLPPAPKDGVEHPNGPA
jgi:predicted TIM-barrel fold metal-dependent hydrolase